MGGVEWGLFGRRRLGAEVEALTVGGSWEFDGQE